MFVIGHCIYSSVRTAKMIFDSTHFVCVCHGGRPSALLDAETVLTFWPLEGVGMGVGGHRTKNHPFLRTTEVCR